MREQTLHAELATEERAAGARQAPHDRRHQEGAANDDRASIGQILQSLRNRQSRTPYIVAAAASADIGVVEATGAFTFPGSGSPSYVSAIGAGLVAVRLLGPGWEGGFPAVWPDAVWPEIHDHLRALIQRGALTPRLLRTSTIRQ